MFFRKKRKLAAAGSPAPDFRLARLEGGAVTLAESIANGPALLVFFKVSCPVCQLTLPFIDRLHRGGSLAIYGVSQNDAEDTRDFMRRFGISFPMLLDAEDDDFPASNAFGISSVPTQFLIEPGGLIARVFEGWAKQDIEWLGTQAGVNPIGPTDRVPVFKAG